MDFSPNAVKKAFRWDKESDIVYAEQHSLSYYGENNKPSNIVKEWMLHEHNEMKVNFVVIAKRQCVYPIVSQSITMLSIL